MGISSGSLMAGIYGVQAISTYSTSQSQAAAQRATGDYTKMMADTNARLSMLNSEDALKRGDLAAGAIQRKAQAVKGAQKVNAAAQGIDINSGSAADLQAETDQMSEIDKMNIKNNAWREAWGYKVQADQYTGKGNMAEINAQYGANQTALTGGLQALGYAAMGGYQYLKGREKQTQDEKVIEAIKKGGPSSQGETPPGQDPGANTRNIASVDDKALRADAKKSQDQTAGELKKSLGYDWREKEYGSDYEDQMYGDNWKQNMSDHYASKSKDNPLFPGQKLQNSWWVKYDDTGDA